MTIIVAASWNGEAYIGCDQVGTDGWGVQGNHGLKVTTLNFGVIGWTGSYRAGQVMSRALRNVAVCSESDVVEIVDKIEAALKGAGWLGSNATSLPSCEDLMVILVSNQGGVWTIQNDLSYLRHDHFAAVGSGYQVALGTLHACRSMGVAPRGACVMALTAACEIVATCGNPAEPIRVTPAPEPEAPARVLQPALAEVQP